jgi:hypothetical protein
MQNYHKESLYRANHEYRLRNEIERTGVYIGNDGHYMRAREEGFRRPIIAHILFGLPYGLTWTDAKGRSRVSPLRWHSVVLRIMEALKEANRQTAIENAWNTSPLTNMYDEHHKYAAASRIQALFRRLEFKADQKMIYDPYCDHPEILCVAYAWHMAIILLTSFLDIIRGRSLRCIAQIALVL